MEPILFIILGIIVLVVSLFLFKKATHYNNQAATIQNSNGDMNLASQLYKSGTNLRMYGIGFIVLGIVLIGYYIKEVVL